MKILLAVYPLILGHIQTDGQMAGYDLDVNVLILLRKERLNLYLMYTKPSSRTVTLSW